MINHARTLLLNRQPQPAAGAEYVPADARELSLPATLVTLRRTLFGTDPDAGLLNYRLREFMTLLHHPTTLPYITAHDPRITYTPADWSPYDFEFGTKATLQGSHNNSDTAALDLPSIFFVSGTEPVNDQRGHMRNAWSVDLGAVVRVALYGSADATTATRELVNGLSPEVPLPQSQLFVRYREPAFDTIWDVVSCQRPQRSLGRILHDVRNAVSDDIVVWLFASAGVAAFRKLWASDDPLQQLRGLLLAIIYQTESVRRGGV